MKTLVASRDRDRTRIENVTPRGVPLFFITASFIQTHDQVIANMPPKRKADQPGGTSRSKKVHVEEDHSAAVALVNTVLADPGDFDIPDDDDELRRNLVALANYARTLEGRVAAASSGSAGAAAPKKKSAEELEVAADKVRRAAVAGITKQMTVRPDVYDLHAYFAEMERIYPVETQLQRRIGQVVLRWHLPRSGGIWSIVKSWGPAYF